MVFIWKWGFFGSRKYNCLFSQNKARKFLSLWTLWNKFQGIFFPFWSRSKFFSILLYYVKYRGNNSQHCWELLRPCWQCCTNKRNDSQQCWDLQCVVGRIQLIRLCKLEFGSHIVACMAPTMLEELCKLLQHCCPKLHRSRNKRNARSCWPTLLRPLARGLTPEITGSSPIACFRQSLVHC